MKSEPSRAERRRRDDRITNARFCPQCNADWQAGAIPQEYIDKGYYAPGSTHYSRLIGMEYPEKYDGVSEWMCPDCGARWDRWTGVLIDNGTQKQ